MALPCGIISYINLEKNLKKTRFSRNRCQKTPYLIGDTLKASASLTIVHEISHRIRIRSTKFQNKNIDPDYLEAILESISGVNQARINSKAASIAVRYDGKKTTRAAVMAILSDLPPDIFNGKNHRNPLRSPITLAAKGVLTAGLLFTPPALAAPIAVCMSASVIKEGLVSLWKYKKIKVEVLDAAAIFFSLIRKDYLTATMIGFLLSLGEYIEETSENRTNTLLKSLLQPKTHEIWIEVDGTEIKIPFQDAQIGDHVICGPGEMIPLDGEVIKGEASVNQSSVTGESVPVHVSCGSQIISGSVVEEGKIVFRATHVGAETSIARISKFIEDSLRYESDSQKRNDELADKLVPVTLGLGLGIFALTRDLRKAAAALTVDYSCVIKLANPVAVRVAMYTAARQGVLLKGAQAMDSLAHVDTLVFDKTGTLTKGRLTITDIIPINGMNPDELLILAASAEEHYSHPVAAAVLAAAKEKGLALSPTSQVDFIVAHGVSAYIDGKNVLAGSRHFIEEDEEIDCSALEAQSIALQKEGKSILYVSHDGKLAGILGLRDELREESAAVLAGLKQAGIKKIVILTGDTHSTAQALAKQLPAVDEVYADLKPEDKAAIVNKLKDQGAIIGFTGDGVNDAPALVSAHVGICLPSGADLAKESAQVILLHENLNDLLTARLAALRTKKTIKNCFFSAVWLNTVFLALATFGKIGPVTSAILHNTSTLGILGYAGFREKQPIVLLPENTDPNPPKKNPSRRS